MVREFLELLYSGDADGAIARAVESPKLLYFNSEVADGFRILAAAMPASYHKPPLRDYTAQNVIGDRVINQITIRSTTKH